MVGGSNGPGGGFPDPMSNGMGSPGMLPPSSKSTSNSQPFTQPTANSRPLTPQPVGSRPAGAPRPQQVGGNAPRPVPAGANGARPNAPAPVAGRPIPVKQRAEGELPETEDEGQDDEPQEVLAEVTKQAPAWLVSLVFHMSALIIMGVWVVAVKINTVEKEPSFVADIAPPPVFAEDLGEQLTDSSVKFQPDKDLITSNADQQIITPQNLPPVENPFAAPPSLNNAQTSMHGTTATSEFKNAPIGLALKGREIGMKKVLIGKYGGTVSTEASVQKSLEWLAKNQGADGFWSLKGPYNDGSAEENQASATAMALIAFQGHGDTHVAGKWKSNVKKGWDALLKKQNKEGDFFFAGPQHHRLYTQAQCTIALCELFGMTNDSKFREPAIRAIKYAVRAQDKGGGWRYEPGNDSDTSVTGWFVIALQSAKMAKLEVPAETLNGITRYLDAAAIPGTDGKEYAYTPNTFSSLAVTAEGLLCREYLGWAQNDPRLVQGCAALNRNPVNYNSAERDVYYWYYATQAMHHIENPVINGQMIPIWDEWNKVMRQEVPEHQVKQGPEAGSWDPQGDKWGNYGGRLYVTCLSTYMLEVYYRHLPIYSGYKLMGGK